MEDDWQIVAVPRPEAIEPSGRIYHFLQLIVDIFSHFPFIGNEEKHIFNCDDLVMELSNGKFQ